MPIIIELGRGKKKREETLFLLDSTSLSTCAQAGPWAPSPSLYSHHVSGREGLEQPSGQELAAGFGRDAVPGWTVAVGAAGSPLERELTLNLVLLSNPLKHCPVQSHLNLEIATGDVENDLVFKLRMDFC